MYANTSGCFGHVQRGVVAINNVRLFSVFVAALIVSSAFAFTSSAAAEQSSLSEWLSKANRLVFGIGGIGSFTGHQVSSTVQCSDSDGGADYYVQGKTVYQGSTLTDTCVDGETVTENYCNDNNQILAKNYPCPYGCKDGACVKGPNAAAPAVDLTITSLTYSPKEPKVEDGINFLFNVQNLGDGTAGLITFYYTIECKNGGTTQSSEISSKAVLKPDEAVSDDFSFTTMKADTCTFTVSAVTDGDSNLQNNKRSVTLTIGEKLATGDPAGCKRANPTVKISPDYQEGKRNEEIASTVTVTNNDNAACGPSRFYVWGASADSEIYADAPPNLNEPRPAISPGGSSSYTFKTRITAYAEEGRTYMTGVTVKNAELDYYSAPNYQAFAKIYVKPAEKAAAACTDSDGGKNYYLAGITISGAWKRTDSCVDLTKGSTRSCIGAECKLAEYSCGDASQPVAEEYYNCPNGCKDGACVQQATLAKPSCKTLGTLMYVDNKDGTGYIGCDVEVSGEFNLEKSYCISQKTYQKRNLVPDAYGRANRYFATLTGLDAKEAVRVYVVSMTGEEVECLPPLNYQETVKPSPSCKDTDAGDTAENGFLPKVPGMVTYNGQSYKEYCVDSKSVVEYYCENGVVRSKVVDCGSAVCAQYKDYGAYCSDSAGGGGGVAEPTLDLANYPHPFLKDGKFDALMVVGDQASSADIIASVDIATGLQLGSGIQVGPAKLASEVADAFAQNVISVGVGCSNWVTQKIQEKFGQLDTRYKCYNSALSGEGVGAITLYDFGNGKAGLVVEGYTEFDVRRAAGVLKSYKDWQVSSQLQGKGILVEATSGGGLKLSGYTGAAATDQTACTDSDGGKNYYVQGVALGRDKEGSDEKRRGDDFCSPGGYLVEHYCDENGIVGIENYYNCVCVNGACVEEKSKEEPTLPPGGHGDQVYVAEIKKGWNLVSFALINDVYESESASSTCSWLKRYSDLTEEYTAKNMFSYDSRNKKYVSLGDLDYLPSTPPDGYLVNTQLNSFWLRSTEDCTITRDFSSVAAGDAVFDTLRYISANKYKLVKSWNFFTVFPGMEGKTLEDIKGSCEVQKAYAFDSLSNKWVNLKGVEFSHGSVGYGFVLKVAGECVLGYGSESPPPLPEGETANAAVRIE
ncbi:hypothetical protein HYV85_00420 [Candidatus Woesearchaeota archaeon]|nr:hypothetical protein [Candidatus Woesearchaeota archaeon]